MGMTTNKAIQAHTAQSIVGQGVMWSTTPKKTLLISR